MIFGCPDRIRSFVVADLLCDKEDWRNRQISVKDRPGGQAAVPVVTNNAEADNLSDLYKVLSEALSVGSTNSDCRSRLLMTERVNSCER